MEQEHTAPQGSQLEHTERELIWFQARYNRLRELMERLLRWDALDNTVEARAWKAQVEETLAETLDETFGPEASAAAPPMSRESLDDVIKAFTAYEAQNAQSE